MRSRGKLVALGGLALAALGIALCLHRAGYLEPAALQAAIEGLGAWAPVGYLGFGILGALLALPSWLIIAVGGFLFGPIWGVVFHVIGATIGASTAFGIARSLGREAVQARLAGRLQRLDAGLATHGLRYMLFVRLVPLFPFNLVSYGAGVTSVPFRVFVLATAVGALPMAALYSYLGSRAAGFLLPGLAP